MQMPWFRQAAGREAHASVVEPVVRNGQTVLNLVVTLRPAELQRIIDRQRLPPEWVGSLLDSQATVVARHPGGVAQAGRSATPDVVERVGLRRDGLIESVSLDGVHTVAYLITLDSGWSFITAMPRARFIGQMPSAVLQVALGALTLVTLAVASEAGGARLRGAAQALRARRLAGRAGHGARGPGAPLSWPPGPAGSAELRAGPALPLAPSCRPRHLGRRTTRPTRATLRKRPAPPPRGSGRCRR